MKSRPRTENRTQPSLSRRGFLRRATVAATLAGPACVGLLQAQAQGVVSSDDEQKIRSALPARALATPRKPRKLLIFHLNVGYGGHPSIATANAAFALMGRKLGAFETVISKEPSVFEAGSLRQFDAVFFNNTVGNMFEDATLRRNLVEFIYRGGGLMGVHGTSVGFTRWPGAVEDWPEFGIMLGARGANHRDSREHVFTKLDDPDHPVNQPFGGKAFDYRDEFFRFGDPYSRRRVRVLFSIDRERTDASQGQARGQVFRQDNDYALAWVRQYGRGRVFYSTIAHNPDVFWDPLMLQFYLAATQFALGDLPGPTTPSAFLTPAIRAQEKLGWRMAFTSLNSPAQTVFEAIEQAGSRGLLHLGVSSLQKTSGQTAKPFDSQLTPDEMMQVRLKLDAAGVRLLALNIAQVPSERAGWQRLFEFARLMGIEVLIADPPEPQLDLVDRLCQEHDLDLAIERTGGSGLSAATQPDTLARLCRGRSKRIGICGNMAAWLRGGIAPEKAIQTLGERLLMLRVSDLDEATPRGRDVAWGSGVAKLGSVFQLLQRSANRPLIFTIENTGNASSPPNLMATNAGFFNETTEQLIHP